MTSTDFTISEFLAFVRAKPADEAYNFCNPNTCAIAQFGRETNRPRLIGLDLSDYTVFEDAVCDGEWTFGALAARLEALEPKSAWTRSDAYLNDLELAKM